MYMNSHDVKHGFQVDINLQYSMCNNDVFIITHNINKCIATSQWNKNLFDVAMEYDDKSITLKKDKTKIPVLKNY